MQLKPLFYPSSIAIIGASTQVGSVGNELVKNLVQQGFAGHIWPVNPKGGSVYGLSIKTDINQIDEKIDLVIIAVPAAIVPEVLIKVGQRQIQAAIVISAGFKESGHPELEQRLVEICQQYDIALIGPNCLGLINAKVKLNASFAPLMPEAGGIAFVSQSGAICASVLDYARERGLGFSKFVSVGNKAVIGEVELLKYLYKDAETKVILLYVEQLSNTPELIEVATDISQTQPHKPIIILKSGRTAAGSQASKSHTGALSGSDTAYDALFARAGIIRANSISELFDLAECFIHNPLPKNNRVAIVTNAGGPGVLTTDALMLDKLRLAELSATTVNKLQVFLPPAASLKNPIDILGDADAERYERSLRLVLADEQVDAVIVILTPQSMTEVELTASAISRLKRRHRKPIIVSFMGQQLVEGGLQILHTEDVATTMFPEPAAKALGALNDFREWLLPANRRTFRFTDTKRQLVARYLEKYGQQPRLLPPDITTAILKAYGLPVLKKYLAISQAEAEAAARHFDGPVVLKIVSPDISHKTEVGGVVLNVQPSHIKAAYHQLIETVTKAKPMANLVGVEISQMVTQSGLELILGISTDPQVGKMILVGLGGIYTEALKDTAWSLVPLTHADAERMLSNLRVSAIIDGTRGQAALDKTEVLECLGRLSTLATHFPQIKEIDINPLTVFSQGKGAIVLDARIILE